MDSRRDESSGVLQRRRLTQREQRKARRGHTGSCDQREAAREIGFVAIYVGILKKKYMARKKKMRSGDQAARNAGS